MSSKPIQIPTFPLLLVLSPLAVKLILAQSDGFGTSNDDSLNSNDTPSFWTSNNRQYYLILFIIAILGIVGLVVLYFGRLRKRKMQNARARFVNDMEAGRGQRVLVNERATGWGQGWGIPMITRSPPRAQREEGLNEHGEAPPPYAPPKEGRAPSVATSAESGGLPDEGHKVPKYEEAILEQGTIGTDMARPSAVHVHAGPLDTPPSNTASR